MGSKANKTNNTVSNTIITNSTSVSDVSMLNLNDMKYIEPELIWIDYNINNQENSSIREC